MAGPRPADQRLRRLLAMLPWLMQHERVSVAEVASRFDVRPEQLVRDLELAAMCGLPPYTDQLIDLYIDEGWIHVGVPRLFTRPLRLTPREGFALAAACRAALELPGADPTGPLATALAKLDAALGERPAMVIELDEPPFLGAVRDAVAGGEELAIEYWSAWREERTARTIRPRVLWSDQGKWYVVAEDSRAGAVRRFRVDRIEALEATGGRFEVRAMAPPSELLTADEGVEVELDLPAAARWVAERYPVNAIEEHGDRLRVRLAVVSQPWFERLLLRLGAEARVVAPEPMRALAAEAAARVLARYR